MFDQNSYPYFNDFDTSKNFQQILFVPGNPVQARELNQMQSILQEQVKKMGNHFFKNGTVVIPGHIFFDPRVNYVKIDTTYLNNNSETYLSSLIGKTITGTTSGVSALVVWADRSTTTDPVTLYIKYTSANGDTNIFSPNEELSTSSLPGILFHTQSTNDYQGNSALCSVGEGVYYMNGYFVGVNAQTIVVSKYNNTPDVTIGLSFTETVVTEKDDISLYDNAQGFPNYTAPGGHRYKISLVLTTKDVEYTEKGNTLSFTDVMQIKGGEIQYDFNDTQYSVFERLLARRTYDESGDYIVTDFKFTTREFRNNNRGQWTASTPYLSGDIITNPASGVSFKAIVDGISGSTEPTTSLVPVVDGSVVWRIVLGVPQFNGGINTITSNVLSDHQEAASKFVVTTSPGKAYIQGYEVKTNGKQLIEVQKSRTLDYTSNAQITPVVGSSVIVTNVVGVPDISIAQPISLQNYLGTEVGTANIRSIELVTTGATTAENTYRLNLINLVMKTGSTGQYDIIYNATKIVNSGGTTFSAKLVMILAAGNNGTLSGVVTSVTNITSSGGTINGQGTLFSKQLSVGMYLALPTSVSGTIIIAPITAITNDVTMSVGTWYNYNQATGIVGAAVGSSPTFPSTNSIPYSVCQNRYDSVSSLLAKLPNGNIKSTRNSAGGNDAMYFVYRTITGTTDGTGYVTFTLPAGSNETFVGTNGTSSNHIIGTTSTSAAPINAYYSYSVSNTTVTIGGTTGGATALASGTTYTAILLMKRLGSAVREKVKTLASKTVIVFCNSGSFTGGLIDASSTMSASGLLTDTVANYNNNSLYTKFTAGVNSGVNSTSSVIPLTEADIIRVTKVVSLDMSGLNPVEISDVTSAFSLDNGQRPGHYDVGTVSVINSSATQFDIATKKTALKITFDYYKHSDGDYFTADSYVGTGFDDIPTVVLNKLGYKLSDYVDFRPRVNCNGNFANTGGAVGATVTGPLASNNTLNISFSYYLSRIDNISLNSTGEFEYNYGNSSLTPVEPVLTDSSLKLVTLSVPAYTELPSNIRQKTMTHARYTMEAIGKIDQRLDNVEEYVSLSLLEKKTADMKIMDAQGYDRYKSGFLVDQFKDVDVLDGSSRVTVDTSSKTMTVPINTRSLPFVVTSTPTGGKYSQFSFAGYYTNNSAITPYSLGYSTTVTNRNYALCNLITLDRPIYQMGATRSVAINPFSVVSFSGVAHLYPPEDIWDQTTTGAAEIKTGNVVGYGSSSWNMLTNNSTPASQLQKLLQANGLNMSFGKSAKEDAALANALSSVSGTTITFTPWQQFQDVTYATKWHEEPTYVDSSGVQHYRSVVDDTGTWNTLMASGDKLSVQQNIDTVEGVDSWLTSAPRMRTKNIVSVVHGLKPNTTLRCFMDGEDITGIHQQPTLLVFTSIAASEPRPFNGYMDTTVKPVSAERQGNTVLDGTPGVTDDRDTYLFGDVITANNGTTGVVISCEYGSTVTAAGSATGWLVYVANVKGAGFTNANSVTTAQGVSKTPSLVSSTQGMRTNSLGNYYGIISFGSGFTTGMKNILYTDSTSFLATGTTQATTTYRSYGNILNERQVIRRDVLSYSLQDTLYQVKFNYIDPVAQSFMLPASYNTGAISTECGLYFADAAKAANGPGPLIFVELVEMQNGIPTNNVVPNATARVNEGAIYDQINGKSDFVKSDTPIVFQWDGPVYLEPNKEYAIKIRSDSLTAKVWVNQQGEAFIGSGSGSGTANDSQGNVSSQQPNASTIGSFFKSQNNSTWTPDQLQDLKFYIKTCVFDVSRSSVIDFTTVHPHFNESLILNPFKITNGSKRVRVYHPNHGNRVNDKVKFEGVVGTYAASLNATFSVARVVNDDVYYVDMLAAASSTENVGGADVTASFNVKYDMFASKVQTMTPSAKTRLTYEISNAADLTNSTYDVISTAGTYYPITSTKYITNYANSPLTAGNYTKFRVIMSTSDVHLSPMIDLNSVSGSFAMHRVTTPSKSDFDTTIVSGTTTVDTISLFSYTPTATQIFFTNGTTYPNYISHAALDVAKAKIGSYIKITGAANTNNNTSTGTEALILGVDQANLRIYVDKTFTAPTTETGAVNIDMYDTYVDEIAPFNGSSEAKYVSRQVTLVNQATELKVMFAVSNNSTLSSYDIYYRTSLKDGYVSLSNTNWTKYVQPANTPSYVASTAFLQFQDSVIDIKGLTTFDVFQIKIVPKLVTGSGDSSDYPIFKDFRVIALA